MATAKSTRAPASLSRRGHAESFERQYLVRMGHLRPAPSPAAKPAAPDIQVLVQSAIDQSKTLHEALLRLDSSLSSYQFLPQDTVHRLMHRVVRTVLAFDVRRGGV
jgi:hypothetical protein